MRRSLHIAVALLTLACGFVVSGATNRSPFGLTAMLAALLLLALSRRLLREGCDAHRLKVAAFTFLFCLAPLSFFTLMLAPLAGFGEDVYWHAEYEDEVTHAAAPPSAREDDTPPCTPGTSSAYADLLWAGAVDGRALSKPKPFYPFEARAERVAGAVTVWVVVDEAGLVLSAEPVAGHPLLRREAAHAACFARFRPARSGRPPVRVSGLLTYRFAP